MDVSKFLEQGNVKSNPNYNPKTKKGRLEQPTFTDYKLGTDIYDQAFKSVADKLSEDISYINPDLASEKYTKYKAYVGANTTEEDLNKERAKNQSWFEQAGHSLMQAGINEVVLGSVLGFANLYDYFANIGKEKGDDDYTNALAQWTENAQEKIKERFDIYREDPNASWAISDFGWWADNFVSVASSASMLIPSTGVIKGISLLGKIPKIANTTGKLSRGIAKVLSAGKHTNTLSKAINAGTEIGATALLSRTMENYMEGRGVYNEVYDSTLSRIKNMTPEEKNDLITRNPNFEGKTNEEIASYLASVSADKTFANDFAMLLMDIPQFKAISSLWKGVTKKEVTAGLRIANRNAARQLLGKEAENTLEATNWLARRKEGLKQMFKNPLTSIEALELGEGFEEGYQGIQTEKGKEVAELILNPKFKTRDLSSYLSDSSIWEQAFWGVLGGIGFQAIGTGLGEAYNKAKTAYNKEHMTAEQYAKSLLTDEKLRETEIKNRNLYLQQYVEDMKLINEGKDPRNYAIDDVTKKPIMVEGIPIHKNITKEEGENIKSEITEELVTRMTIDAINAGNYDLLRNYLSDPTIDKYFKDNGIEATTADSALSKELINKMDTVAEIYEGFINDVFTSADVDNPQVGTLLATELTRIKLYKDKLTNNLNDLSNRFNTTSDNLNNDNQYLNNERKKYIRQEVDKIDKLINELNQRLVDGKITREGYDATIDDINNRTKQLTDYAKQFGLLNNTDITDIHQIREQRLGNKEEIDRDIARIQSLINTNNELLTKLDREHIDKKISTKEHDTKAEVIYKERAKNVNKLNELNNTLIISEPKQEVQDIVKQQIITEDAINYNNTLLPKTKEDYRKQYKDKYDTTDAIARKRFTDAVDKVNKWLEKQDNLNEATDNLLRNRVPELDDALEILKIGYAGTSEYLAQINAAIKQIIKDRATAEEKKKEVIVDGKKITEEKAEETNAAVKEHNDAAKPIETESKKPTDESPSSTGEEQQASNKQTESVPPGVIVAPEEEYAAAEQQAKQDAKKIAAQFDLDTISKAKLDANSVVIESYKSKKDLYNSAVEKGINSNEANELFKYVTDKLVEKGYSEEIANNVANDAVKTVFNVISGALNRKGQTDAANKFRKFSAELALKTKVEINEDGRLSIADSIENNEIQQAITNFIDSYIDFQNSIDNNEHAIVVNEKGKTVINLESIFDYLINNPDIGVEEAKMIFYNIQHYIAINANSKYKFIGKVEVSNYFNNPSKYFEAISIARQKVETIDNYMHVNAPTKKDEKYFNEIQKVTSGSQVEIEKGKNKDGEPIETALSIKSNGVEIGYIATVDISPDFTTYRIRSQKSGFVDVITKNADGTLTSTMDELINGVIEANTDEFKTLYDYCSNYISNTPINEEDANIILNLPIIKKYIENNYIKFSASINAMSKTEGVDAAKARYIIRQLSSIVFFDTAANTVNERKNSYMQWKYRKYINYANTYKIQTQLNDRNNKDKLVTTLANIGNTTPIIGENHDINKLSSITYDRNPIMAFTNNGIINEATGITYSNTLGFQVGNMGMLIGDNQGAPIIAMFTEANNISVSPEIENGIRQELTSIITDFQNGSKSFEETSNRLSELLGGPKVEGANLFSGFTITKTSTGTIVNKQGNNGIVLIINKFKKDSREAGTGISYFKDADKTKGRSSIKVNDKFIKEIVDDLVSQIKFNRSFYTIKNAKNGNEHSNRYVYKKNGKLIVKLAGKELVYNNFGEFVLKNNAFKTNQQQNNQGGFFNFENTSNDIYIKVASVSSPVEESLIDTKSTSDIIKSATSTKGVSTTDLLNSVGISKDVQDVLTGKNAFGINLIPDVFYYNKNLRGANSIASKGKVIFGNKGITAIGKNKDNLIRLLIHENLHLKFAEEGLFDKDSIFSKQNIVEDLIDTYNQTINAIEKIINTGNKDDIQYKRAVAIKAWIEKSSFNPIDYFTSSSDSQNAIWAKLSETERKQIFAEEWLTESLTQSELIKFLNEAEYVGEEIKVEGIADEKKTIWQKIIDIILKLFGKYTDNVHNNTILAKQYQILGNKTDVDAKTEIETEINHNEETHKNDVDGQPVVDVINDVKTKETKTEEDEYNVDLNGEEEEDFPDELDDRLAVTEELNITPKEINIDSYRNDTTNNPNGFEVISDMNDYLSKFDDADKPLISKMLESNELKFICQ